MKSFTKFFGVIALSTVSLLFSGCGGNSSYSYVKFIHASAGAPNVDVQVGSDFAAKNAAFGSATSAYAKVAAGTDRKIQVFAAGKDTTAVLSTKATLMKDKYYTIIALNTPTKLQAALEDDDLTAPTAGNCKLRVVHASTLAGPVDVYVTAPGVSISDPNNPVTPVLSNFTFGTVTQYLQVPAGAYEVRVTVAGDPTQVAIDTGATGVQLASGSIYTAVALDPNPNSNPPGTAPTLLLTQDQPVPGVKSMATTM
ncbi:MAG: DUF4397 domain-containing protein [Acidobacteriota bacterium]|nr:DUF4397 domain-containing protein [Acidobacteriota bacterium]